MYFYDEYLGQDFDMDEGNSCCGDPQEWELYKRVQECYKQWNDVFWQYESIKREKAELERALRDYEKQFEQIGKRYVYFDAINKVNKGHIEIIKTPPNYNKSINDEEIKRMYDEGYPIQKIADIVGCCYNTVCNRLTKMSIKYKKRKDIDFSI